MIGELTLAPGVPLAVERILSDMQTRVGIPSSVPACGRIRQDALLLRKAASD
jgi:hypothetical protein